MDITDTSVGVPEHNFLPKSRFDIDVTPNIDFLSTQQDSEISYDEDESVDDAISHEGLIVSFQDLEFVVQNQADKKHKISLLKKVSGVLYPGLMSALMGPSGSGKTTLLDCLSGRKTTGEVKGTILFAGRPASKSFLRRFTGYVEQFDTLLDNLTVYEQLLYTSELKNPQRESLARKRERVEVVIDQLAMEGCRDITIGSALKRGISGGQAKRVNIGIALVTNPRVLFLDEPTSGLDSYTANEVMLVVKGLTKSGITICATIHSPTPFAYNIFDRMQILLGGHVIYFGHGGLHAVKFFEDTNPHVPAFASYESEKDNPAEWIVDLTTQADREGRGLEMAETYAVSALAAANQLLLEADIANPEPTSAAILKELRTRRGTNTNFFFALKTILKFRMRRDFTDPAYLGPRILDKLAITLITFTLYWKQGKDLLHNPPDSDVVARTLQFTSAQTVGAMLFMQTILPAFAASTYTPSLVLERTTYYRERADGLFTPFCYLASKLVGELIIAICNCVVFGAMVFYLVKLSGSYPLFFLVNFCTTSIGIVLGYFVAAISPNMEVANALLPAYVISLLFFIGLLIRVPDIPHYWRWFIWVNPLHYAWVAMMINQFNMSNLIVPYQGPVLPYFGIAQNANKWEWLGFEACFFFTFLLLAWLAFTFIKHQKR